MNAPLYGRTDDRQNKRKGGTNMNFQNPDTSVLSDKKLYIFDMDGTIYLGFDVFPYAIRFIKNLRKNGKKVMFFTNNASHTTEYYVQKLSKLGFEPSPRQERISCRYSRTC